MYVYVMSEQGYGYNLYTVGFYSPDGKWHPDSDWNYRKDAADRAAYLNGASVSNEKVKE